MGGLPCTVPWGTLGSMTSGCLQALPTPPFKIEPYKIREPRIYTPTTLHSYTYTHTHTPYSLTFKPGKHLTVEMNLSSGHTVGSNSCRPLLPPQISQFPEEEHQEAGELQVPWDPGEGERETKCAQVLKRDWSVGQRWTGWWSVSP